MAGTLRGALAAGTVPTETGTAPDLQIESPADLGESSLAFDDTLQHARTDQR